MGKKIFLVGFMGAGKSTIGKLLATELKLTLKDTDSIIEKRAQLSISEIFEQHGEDFFRYLEGVVLHELLINPENGIISTGGGLPCFDNRMGWMNQKDITIYLKCSPEVIFERITSQPGQRPLLNNRTDKEIHDFISHQLTQREPIYQQALITVNAESDQKDIVSEIMQQLKQLEAE